MLCLSVFKLNDNINNSDLIVEVYNVSNLQNKLNNNVMNKIMHRTVNIYINSNQLNKQSHTRDIEIYKVLTRSNMLIGVKCIYYKMILCLAVDTTSGINSHDVTRFMNVITNDIVNINKNSAESRVILVLDDNINKYRSMISVTNMVEISRNVSDTKTSTSSNLDNLEQQRESLKCIKTHINNTSSNSSIPDATRKLIDDETCIIF